MAENKGQTLSELRKGDKGRNGPTFECGNCKCKRYNPCACQKKGGVRVSLPDETPVPDAIEEAIQG
jgi:hypothetical protein